MHFEAGYVPPHHSVEDFAQAIRAIGEPIHDRRADEISMAKLLTLLFEITGLFDMATRTELVMLQKTMVVVEGVARTLDPKLDMWTTSEPVVRDWIERHLGPVGRIENAGRGAFTLAGVLADLPDLALRGERVLRQLEQVTSARRRPRPGDDRRDRPRRGARQPLGRRGPLDHRGAFGDAGGQGALGAWRREVVSMNGQRR